MAGRPRSDPSARVKPDSCWFRAWRELESWACAARQSSAGLGRSDPLAYHGRPRPTQRQNGADGGLGEKFGLRCQLPSGSVTKRQASWRRRPARAGAWVHHKCPNGRPRMPKRRPLSCRKRGSLPRRRGRAGRLGDPSQWAGFEGRRSARSRSRGRDKLGPSFRSAARAGRAPPGLVCDPCEAGAASVLPRRAPAP